MRDGKQAARKRITWQVNTFLHLLALALDRHSTHWSRKLKLTHQRSILWQQLIGHFLSLCGTLQKFTPSPTRTYFPLLWLFVSFGLHLRLRCMRKAGMSCIFSHFPWWEIFGDCLSIFNNCFLPFWIVLGEWISFVGIIRAVTCIWNSYFAAPQSSADNNMQRKVARCREYH